VKTPAGGSTLAFQRGLYFSQTPARADRGAIGVPSRAFGAGDGTPTRTLAESDVHTWKPARDGPGAVAEARFRCDATLREGAGRPCRSRCSPVAANLLDRQFTAAGPNQRWVGDTTEFVIGESGKLYLAAILDLFSRFVAGWAVSAVNDRHLTLKALDMALKRRCPDAGHASR
jgi:transposase InsO family protein